MDVSCTVGRDGRRYYFLNGRRTTAQKALQRSPNTSCKASTRTKRTRKVRVSKRKASPKRKHISPRGAQPQLTLRKTSYSPSPRRSRSSSLSKSPSNGTLHVWRLKALPGSDVRIPLEEVGAISAGANVKAEATKMYKQLGPYRGYLIGVHSKSNDILRKFHATSKRNGWSANDIRDTYFDNIVPDIGLDIYPL